MSDAAQHSAHNAADEAAHGTPPDVAYIALGSNLGDRAGHLALAVRAIASIPGVTVLAQSSVEETAPIGPVVQGDFLNQMIAIRTVLDPRALLAQLQRIEREGGRVRDARWGPRTIDLDIVSFETTQWNDAYLVLPHPEAVNRPFWQRELVELSALRASQPRSASE
ncbi:MAG: 2-amino-4-hydroxy-6-hydroxymethyldihydropteridine diphosphokinase [Gemmatimonadaceae bacterium]